jgi:hypothetical protein
VRRDFLDAGRSFSELEAWALQWKERIGMLYHLNGLRLEHWQEIYGYRPVLLETFVEKQRFQGTCYNAANWVYLGQTKGRGKLGPAGKQSVPIKGLWVYPLGRRFRDVLTR